MTLARGFKAFCERLVVDVRAELTLSEDEPIDMPQLAEFLDIPVFSLDHFVRIGGHRADVTLDEIYVSVSAFTVFDGSRRTIVYNDRHQPARHRSNLAHELAHALLLHPPERTSASAQLDADREDEAEWLSGVMMLTANQARAIAKRRIPSIDAQRDFQLSAEMLRYRLNVTGAARIARA